MLSHAHIVGAGVAGLAAAVRLAIAGVKVTVYEAAGHAGGRCRSFYDSKLARRIDNGNHLLLSGNRSVAAYLKETGASDSLSAPNNARFNFFDLQNGQRWTVGGGLSSLLDVPGGRLRDYIAALKLRMAAADVTVAACLDTQSRIYRNFWQPLAVGVLNISPQEGAASLLGAVMGETFGKGKSACCPRIARDGLSASFIDPALKTIETHGGEVLFNQRLKSLGFTDDVVSTLDFGEKIISLPKNEAIILALPPAAATMVPGLTQPKQSRAIVNGHFLLANKGDDLFFIGLVGGVSQWLFVRGDIASVTVSDADDLALESEDVIAQKMWGEVVCALGLGDTPLPNYRIIKEKRATFAQTPQAIAQRPGTISQWRNLFLAGDWIDTGLPATIEGAVRSGHNAASAITLLSTDPSP